MNTTVKNTLNKILYYMFLCHRIPERSFFYRGKQFPICARCTGILIGYFLGIIYIMYTKKIHPLGEFLLMIPLVIDGIGQLRGYWISNNSRRLVTGVMAGIATISFFRIAGVFGMNSGKYFFRLIFYMMN